MPFFSVVITVYNKARFIESTLKSVLRQTFDDIEVLIINDGSTDDSLSIIKSFSDRRIQIISKENEGASVARNTGIEAANCNYIALLDGDDLWDKDYLRNVYNAIQKYPDQKIFTCAVAQKYQHKVIPVDYSFQTKELYSIHNYFEASKKYTLITSSSVVFHNSILEKTGLFDPKITSGQDSDLWIRFGLHFEVVFINKLLVHYNYDPLSLSNTTFQLRNKPRFDNYSDEEKRNASLKSHLDRNRYSMAILSKLQDDKQSFNFYKSNLDRKNLGSRQRFLLGSPKWLLKLLLKLKSTKGEKLYYPES